MSKENRRSGGYEDISSFTKPEGFRAKLQYFWEYKFKLFFLRNQKRNLKALLSILICLILVFAAVCGVYMRRLIGLVNHDSGESGNPDLTFLEETEENLSFQTMYDIGSADSIDDLIKSWALNGGEKLYSKNVINVLLIGEDNDDGSHRSDSTMLVSVNTKTKKITICSFLRDAYTYMNINGSERYDKTNHAYSWGGAAKLMDVLTNNYKIRVDRFVSIDFGSFIKVIDVLGGVTVPVTEAEANYMNRTTRIKGFEAGEAVTLDGEHALVYSRIRKLDGEEERTRRQRTVIESIIRNAKASSFSDLNKALETFLPYVTTNLSTTEILSLGTQALSEGWLRYPIVSMVEPSEENKVGVNGFRTYTGYLDVWIVDYIKCARELQLALYDRTNIEIDPETHISAVDLVNGNYHSAGGYDAEETTEPYGYRQQYHYYDYEDENGYDEEETTRRGLLNWTMRNPWETTRQQEGWEQEEEPEEEPITRLPNPFVPPTQQEEEAPPAEEEPPQQEEPPAESITYRYWNN